MIRTIRACRRY